MTDHLELLRTVAQELERAGAAPGMDFFVHYVSTGAASSEFYGLRTTPDGGYEIYYSDMGVDRVIDRTKDAADARATFTEKVLDLAGRRGYGPRAVQHPPSVPLRHLRNDNG